MKKEQREKIAAADTKQLRAIAATMKIKFIGKKTEDLRAELLAAAGAGVEQKAVPQASRRREKSPDVSAEDAIKADGLAGKKQKVAFLRAAGYSTRAMAEFLGMHPTNVARCVRDLGMSTSTATVPEERKARIRAAIAARKLAIKAEPVDAPAAPEPEQAKAPAAKKQKERA